MDASPSEPKGADEEMMPCFDINDDLAVPDADGSDHISDSLIDPAL